MRSNILVEINREQEPLPGLLMQRKTERLYWKSHQRENNR